jgi:hypothetical protein
LRTSGFGWPAVGGGRRASRLFRRGLRLAGGRALHHPEHEAAVRACLAATAGTVDIEVIGDGALERGSAVFETARGSLDASAETQLAEIERGLTDRLRSPR